MTDYADMEKLVECPVCLERLVNPKVLNCAHSFCRHCLDKLFEHRDNGVMFIHCPLRCKEETILDAGKSVDDLMTSLHLNNIVKFLADAQVKQETNPDKLNEKCQMRSVDEAINIRSILVSEIQRKKKISVKQYIEKLIDAEQIILNQFDSLISDHFSASMLADHAISEDVEIIELL